jgi:hypothetical protein
MDFNLLRGTLDAVVQGLRTGYNKADKAAEVRRRESPG